ncbi:zf-HC2 domain-containing protein [Psychromonas sp. PT13]|uniref:zf-HC2 domain-containing protein n=1 Tax=Psychromonas sp. PT13 TaxID=3439547 RepID=UPI003EBC3D80
MINCKQATRLLSEKLDRELSKKEKMALFLHTTLCGCCRKFSGQMEDLRDISKLYMKENQNNKK